MDELEHTIARIYPILRNTANKLLDKAWYAEDIVQDTLLELLVKIQNGIPVQDVSRYCIGILKHKCRRALFRNKRYVPVQVPDLEYLQTIDPEDRDILDALDQAMGELPDLIRHLLKLRYADGISPETLAKRYNLSTPTLWRKLTKAKEQLRKKLE